MQESIFRESTEERTNSLCETQLDPEKQKSSNFWKIQINR